MKQQINIGHSAAITLASLLALSGCGGGSGSSGSGTGKLNLGVTDAPVDSAEEVVVTFTGLELKPVGGEAIVIDLPENKQINLLSLQGGEFEFLTEDYTLPAGDYEWIRLKMLSDRNSAEHSYIAFENDDKNYPLYIPNANNPHGGLKLDKGNFTIIEDGVANLTIDFDLRRSIVEPKNASESYMLKPVLRLVQNADVGHIKGTVAPEFYDADSTCAGAVYLYAGSDATPIDFDGTPPEPFTSGVVNWNPVSLNFEYGIGFVPAGEYTVSFTCDADLDLVEQDDSANITFLQTSNVTVNGLFITRHNFAYLP